LFRGVWGAGVPSVKGPCLADEAADGDDGVGEVEERVDDGFAALVAALEAVEAVVPGVGPLNVPALPGLDRALLPLCAISPFMPRDVSSPRVLCES
jgi:hypothetical protein